MASREAGAADVNLLTVVQQGDTTGVEWGVDRDADHANGVRIGGKAHRRPRTDL